MKPPITPTQAHTILQTHYGRFGTATPLVGEQDANFHMHTADGDFVLKVMHAGQDTAVLDMQLQALAHLAAQLPDVALPRVQPTRDGQPMTKMTVNGRFHLVWLLRYLPGTLLADTNPQLGELRRSFGKLLGQVDAALSSFAHPAAARLGFKWDLAQADWIVPHVAAIADPDDRALVQHFWRQYETAVVPHLPHLRRSVIHGDANDYNVLTNSPRATPRRVVSLIDFGDMLHTITVSEIAVATAYAMLGQPDPLTAAAEMIGGYHAAHPLTEPEIELLFSLIATRLCVSVVNSALRKADNPDDPYITISEQPAWVALRQLANIHPRLAHYVFRQACGLAPVPQHTAVTRYLQTQAPAKLLDGDLTRDRLTVLDLSVSSLFLGADPANWETAVLTPAINQQMAQDGSGVAIGRYDEARPFYTVSAFNTGSHPTDAHRTVHVGIDLYMSPGTAVYAPLDGTVVALHNAAARLDYGPLIILRHATPDGVAFYTLYGHLSPDNLLSSREEKASFRQTQGRLSDAARSEPFASEDAHSSFLQLTLGQAVTAGERIATIGASPQNGDWPPHLHFQIILDLLELAHDFPGVVLPSQRDVWRSLSPDPNLLLGIPADRFPPLPPSREETLAQRRRLLGGNLSLSYQEPLHLVRGWMQYLYDENGRAYLDVYNNVPHVGHSHPQVSTAVQQQIALLNSNTRYLHPNIIRYAARLTALMPDPLTVCYLLNSASEANELALRLARTHTGHYDMLVMAAAYHGHTSSLIDISPYKFAGPGGRGAKPWIHQVPIPDDYRGSFKRDDPNAGRKYAQQVADIIDQLRQRGSRLAGFICETLPSVGGQIVLPPGYLAEVYEHVRAAGGVCIADEVQVGFGRLGSHFWGFAMQAAVPDIVVLGKPIGNGFPVAAVVTTAEIAASFDNGMEFFSTFGGNPVACAAATAVLDVIEAAGLQAHAQRVGGHLLAGLRQLVDDFAIVGDARGAGLFLGLELVRDRQTLQPADWEASYVVNRLQQRSVLAGTDGPYHNVIKIRPPLPFTLADADFLLGELRVILQEDALTQA